MRNPHNQCQPRTEQQLRRRSTFTAVVERRRIPFPTFIQFFHRAIDKRTTHQNAASLITNPIHTIYTGINRGWYLQSKSHNRFWKKGRNEQSLHFVAGIPLCFDLPPYAFRCLLLPIHSISACLWIAMQHSHASQCQQSTPSFSLCSHVCTGNTTLFTKSLSKRRNGMGAPQTPTRRVLKPECMDHDLAAKEPLVSRRKRIHTTQRTIALRHPLQSRGIPTHSIPIDSTTISRD